MVFKVPQFIEVEDKIFGPFTFKQFIYLVGGAGACFLLWSFLPKFIAILLILPMAGLAIALAFVKINNRPFVILMEAFLRFHLGGKLYLWQRAAPKKGTATPKKSAAPEIALPALSGSKLRDLAWSLDVNESAHQTNG